VSVGTVRYQLKQVMAKVGVSRQSQLVQRLYSSVIAQALA
jgi:DNA-binding CsgD family transcriptional regulator